jgi:probable rRNA maturation factor
MPNLKANRISQRGRRRKTRTPMEIWIQNDCETGEIDQKKLRLRAEMALTASGCGDAELSVWLCDDHVIRELHREYLGRDTATNVISFSQREGEFGEVEPEMLGDVVISFETARRDAVVAGQSIDDHLTHLLLHGILHLLGYDHEGDNAHQAPAMEARQAELFRLIFDEI